MGGRVSQTIRQGRGHLVTLVRAPGEEGALLQSAQPHHLLERGVSRASSLQMRFSVGTCACGSEDEPLVSSFPLWPRVVRGPQAQEHPCLQPCHGV